MHLETLLFVFQLASLVVNRQNQCEPFASNCLERLRAIKRLRKRVTNQLNMAGATTGKNYGTGGQVLSNSQDSAEKTFVIEDFTDYV